MAKNSCAMTGTKAPGDSLGGSGIGRMLEAGQNYLNARESVSRM